MLHRSAIDDEARQFQSRPFMDHPNRPSSRSSRPGSRNRMVKPSGAVTPTGLGVLTENAPPPPPDTLQSTTSPIREGLGSLNRWSQSTTSSRSVSDYTAHHRGSSKASMSNYSPQRGTALGELPEISLPELRASQMFSSDPNSHLDLSFTASSEIFQNSANNNQFDSYEQPQTSFHPKDPRSSELSMDGDADGRQTQKAMLSKALQKANTAVLLDNAANFEGAMEAYTEACHLLQLVMLRSSGGDEEKLKLQEIRDTYMIRITELQRMDLHPAVHDNKALPQRPVSEQSYDELLQGALPDEPRIQSQHSSAHSSFGFQPQMDDPKSLPADAIPARRQSLRPSTLEEFRNIGLPKTSQSGRSTPGSTNSHYSGQYFDPGENAEQSWLDTIDESGASSPSSANSRASSVYLRRRTSRRLSTGTEAEFDAALDAAVEAAYDEGLEPVLEYNEEASDDIVANARRNIELAKQRVREAEREAQEAMQRGRNLSEPEQPPVERDSVYLDEEAEEEERLLEEMTKGYVMDDFEFGIQSKSALPRESDSSNMSGRTWESSAASNITGTGAALSTLAEDEDVFVGGPSLDRNVLPSAPPNAALPPIPAVSDFPALPPHRISLSNPPPPGPPPPPPSMGPPPPPGVRARRLSKNNSVDLRVHTRSHSRADSNFSHPRAESVLSHARVESNASAVDPFSIPTSDKPPPPLPKDEASDVSRPSTPGFRANLHPSKRNPSVGSLSEHFNLARARTQEDEEPGLPPLPASARPMAKIPSAPDGLNKAGAKSFRSRNGSMPNPDVGPGSPVTPWEDSFPPLDTQLAMPIMPTPTNTNFSPTAVQNSGMNLFDYEIHSPTSPGRPNSLIPNAPAPLEPCPESFLLRPFWLMRCLYQTIAHPHGGYISAKLFIPRDIWRVKNVKLKAIEDKVSQCDLLTAALLKLARVDPYDADAVLDEMEGFETILNQVQTALTKKLGNEVGVQTAVPLFKPNGTPEDSVNPEPAQPRSSGTSNKSYIPGWKRLRAKTSGIGTTASTTSTPRESHKENLTLNTVPMTMGPVSQPVRNVTKLEFSGPHAHYMGALARLFDAAQVIDQIAQQVEDPGLKHSSKTHVGLELVTRHAAEFFGFYICRFALADINLMLDKFIKRGSEWVLI